MSLQNSTTRCSKCKKKTLLLNRCSCENIFCLQCRLPEVHECNYDFIKSGKKILEIQNPVVVREKIDKI